MFRNDTLISNGERRMFLEACHEVLAVLIGLKPDQVVGEHCPHKLAVVRDRRKGGPLRPRRVQEETDRTFHTQIPQLKSKRQQMIVMNPEKCIGCTKAKQRARHVRVDLPVG